IFWACQKEETTEKSNVISNSNKIQKLPTGKTYEFDFYTQIGFTCYHVTGILFEWKDINQLTHSISDGLTYTEVDCNSLFVTTNSPIEFAYAPDPDFVFLCEDDYKDANNYIFEVISGEVSPEMYYLFLQKVLDYYYTVLIFN
ncbi:MAG: hypothetical protein WCQ79_08360, partial [Bacteroidales bacterium]